jgi:hypothetical protein
MESMSYYTDWYKRSDNAQRVRNSVRARQKLITVWLREVRSNPCTDCGKTYPPYVMEHDHRDPTLKLKSVSAMARFGWSRERIITEIKKCDLVCSNCHKERTHQRRLSILMRV